MPEPSTLNDPILALSEYFLSARVMHDLTHEIRPIFFGSTKEEQADLWTEFRTYYSYWLSGLFVVAEGFQTLGLRSPKIEKLIADISTSFDCSGTRPFIFRRRLQSTFNFMMEPAIE